MISSQVVEYSQNDTKGHLKDTKCNGHLHLVRISEEQLILCNLPNLRERERENN